MYSKQEMFDIAAKHLLKQNKQCGYFDDEQNKFRCLYRGDDGTKCAIGALIPDELYCESMENKTAQSLVEHHDGISEIFDDGWFANRLQRVHDDNPEDKWYPALKTFAAVEFLDFSKVEQFYKELCEGKGDA